MDERDKQIFKIGKRYKEKQEWLDTLVKDNILMRQDISTYQAKVDRALGVSNMCETLE